MKFYISYLVILLFLFGCYKEDEIAETPLPEVQAANPTLPEPDHIVFVWMENKNYSEIIGSPNAPYINSLIEQGTLFTNMHSISHPSYPEYIRFFSGSSQGKTNDDCINGSPYNDSNLYTLLKSKEKTFAWYSEGLPSTGSTECTYKNYVERHNPTQAFANVPEYANKRFQDFPADYSLLEHVICISPNLQNDMHDGSIIQGDTWLKDKLSGLIEWCKTHNSIFVVYFDEGSQSNDIPVIAIGEYVKRGYKSDINYDHYNWSRTILSMFGAGQMGITSSREDIKDCWD